MKGWLPSIDAAYFAKPIKKNKNKKIDENYNIN